MTPVAYSAEFPIHRALRREAILASEPDALPEATAMLETLIADAGQVDEPVGPADAAVPVTFHLDLPGTPTWTPVAREPAALVLPLERPLPNSGRQQTWRSLALAPTAAETWDVGRTTL